MQIIGAKLSELISSLSIKEVRPQGLIKCEASDGNVGYTGNLESGWLFRTSKDFSDLLRTIKDGGMQFSELLCELHQMSRDLPEGPWYRCNITVTPDRKISFRYWWEGTPFDSIHQLERSINGRVPQFVFSRRFDRALIPNLSNFEVDNSLLFYVPRRVYDKKQLSDLLLEVYATIEWESDVNNGAMDQYFARDHDPMTGLPRSALYVATRNGLRRMGRNDIAELFDESIALYAHFHQRVETARLDLGIAAVERKDESDIMNRYYALTQSLSEARVAYIRDHIVELEQQ